MNTSLKYNSHYDASMDYGITMYDQLPYRRDADRCNGSNVTLNSGHIIKYYMYRTSDSYYTINNKDDCIQQILHTAALQEQKRREAEAEPIVEATVQEDDDSGETEAIPAPAEQLPEDTGPEPVKHSEEPVNLDDVEDW